MSSFYEVELVFLGMTDYVLFLFFYEFAYLKILDCFIGELTILPRFKNILFRRLNLKDQALLETDFLT